MDDTAHMLYIVKGQLHVKMYMLENSYIYIIVLFLTLIVPFLTHLMASILLSCLMSSMKSCSLV